MSGGVSGLGGYVFQQRYLTLKVLSSVAGQLLERVPSLWRADQEAFFAVCCAEWL